MNIFITLLGSSYISQVGVLDSAKITKKAESIIVDSEVTIKRKSNDNYTHQASQPKTLLANEIRQKSCPVLINHTPVPMYLSVKGHLTK